MECPKCQNNLIEIEELSRGMGGQSFKKCVRCGTIVLCSGERITQTWPGDTGQEGGNNVTYRTVRRL